MANSVGKVISDPEPTMVLMAPARARPRHAPRPPAGSRGWLRDRHERARIRALGEHERPYQRVYGDFPYASLETMQTTIEETAKHTVRPVRRRFPTGGVRARDLDRAYRKLAGEVKILEVPREATCPGRSSMRAWAATCALESSSSTTRLPRYYAQAVRGRTSSPHRRSGDRPRQAHGGPASEVHGDRGGSSAAEAGARDLTRLIDPRILLSTTAL